MNPGEPQWLPEDTEAALEWLEWKDSLCSGCGQPRHEAFDSANTDAYSVTALECHPCAARERRAYADQQSRDAGQPPAFGRFYAVTLDDDAVKPPTTI